MKEISDVSNLIEALLVTLRRRPLTLLFKHVQIYPHLISARSEVSQVRVRQL